MMREGGERERIISTCRKQTEWKRRFKISNESMTRYIMSNNILENNKVKKCYLLVKYQIQKAKESPRKNFQNAGIRDRKHCSIAK